MEVCIGCSLHPQPAGDIAALLAPCQPPLLSDSTCQAPDLRDQVRCGGLQIPQTGQKGCPFTHNVLQAFVYEPTLPSLLRYGLLHCHSAGSLALGRGRQASCDPCQIPRKSPNVAGLSDLVPCQIDLQLIRDSPRFF